MHLLTRLILIFILFPFFTLGQTEPMSSLYNYNGLMINPAYAGSHDLLTVNIMHRKQWVGVNGTPSFQLVSAHAPLSKESLSIGAIASTDKHGVTRNSKASVGLAYRIFLGEKRGSESRYISFGLQAGAVLMSSRFSEVITADVNDPAFSYDVASKIAPDFAAGLYYKTPKFTAGVSVPSIIQKEFSQDLTAIKLSLNPNNLSLLTYAHYYVPLNGSWIFKPSTMIRWNTYGTNAVDLNASFIYQNRMSAGLSYRAGSALVMMIEAKATAQFKLSYGYDFAVGTTSQYSRGSHEIGLQYEFGHKISSFNPRDPF